MTKVLVFGESISWGAFDLEKGGWVQRLKIHYLQSYNQAGIGVYDCSVSGSNTQQIMQTFEHDIKKIQLIEPEDLLFIFSIGSNDCSYKDTKGNYTVNPEQFKKNLYAFIEKSKHYTTKIIFTGLLKVDDAKTKPWIDNEYWDTADLKKYDAIIQEVCKEQNIPFIPFWNVLDNPLLHDGLHPNTEGHKQIYECVKKILDSYLEND